MRELLSPAARFLTPLAGSLALLAGIPAPAPAAVLLNEFKVEDTQQFLELRNTGPGRVPLDLLGLQTSAGSLFPLAVGDTLEPGEHRVFPLPDALLAVERIRRRGDVLELFDPALEAVLDRVDFGDTGGSPADILADVASTFARVTSAPDPNGSASATSWTVDFVGTLGAQNDAVPPALGGDVVVNEIIPGPANAVVIELYNQGAGTVDLGGWSLTSAQCHVQLAGTVAPGGFRTFLVTPLIFDFNLTVYLFAPGDVRVDQMGLSDSPGVQTTYQQALGAGNSFQRFPDGNGPHDGYDLDSIGFPVAVQVGPPSPGSPNPGSVGISAGEAPPATLRLAVAPNPLVGGSEVRIALVGAEGRQAAALASRLLTLRIYDLQGRLVDLATGLGPALGWTPPAGVPPGVYFLTLESPTPGREPALGPWSAKLAIQP